MRKTEFQKRLTNSLMEAILAEVLQDKKGLLFVALSGIAGATSWLFYFLALKYGPVSKVAPIDKLSVALVVIFGILFLHEKLSWQVVTGTIRRPNLYPIPDVILLNFDEVFGYERRETILIEIAAKLHPQVTIIACSEEWCDCTKKFAKQFGVDDCFDNSKIKELLYRIDIYRQVYDAV